MRSERGSGSGGGSASGANEGSPVEGVAEAVRTGSRAVSETTTEVSKRIRGWRDTVVREAKERPARTAAIALGAGYLLGGGLFSGLTARLVGTAVRVSMRLALIPLVTQSLASVSDGLLGGLGGLGGGSKSDDEAGDSPQGRSETRNGRRHSEHKETNQ